jgi:SAM-dependent methyltransferase
VPGPKRPKLPEPVAPPPPRRERRALSHVGGKIELSGGSPEEQEALRSALAVSADEGDVMADMHGFHSYPARLHPLTARGLVAGLSRGGDTVLDPFCGSGTVLVEARALGRRAWGSDLNPLAVELAWLKTHGSTEKFASDLTRAAQNIAEVADERRLGKAAPTRLYPPDDRERYPIHILLELDSLSHGVDQLRGGDVRRALRLVISSTLTKLAHSEGDTTRRKAPRRLPGGFAIKLFTQKTEELVERLAEYSERIPARAPRSEIAQADARDLQMVPPNSVNLVVTSPPYPGVYDYLDHHMHRIRWLGLSPDPLARLEIGARREYKRLSLLAASRRWQDEMGAALREMRRVLTPDGRAVVVVADSVVERKALRADVELQKAASKNGLEVTARASQARPLFLHGADRAFADAPRREHVCILRPSRRV